MSFLHPDLPTLQRGLQLSWPQRLAQIVIHPCRKTLFAFSLQGVSRQGDDVDRRLPRARWAQPAFPIDEWLGKSRIRKKCRTEKPGDFILYNPGKGDENSASSKRSDKRASTLSP
jgi:hypothetical protein